MKELKNFGSISYFEQQTIHTWLQCVSRMYPHALSLALGICPANTLLNRLWTKFFGWWIWLLSSCFSTFFSSLSLDVPVWKEVERGSKAKLVCLSRALQPLICLRGRLSVVSSTLLHTPAAETPRFWYKAISLLALWNMSSFTEQQVRAGVYVSAQIKIQ